MGSIAIALLSELGYEVVAVTGKASSEEWLKKLGAASTLPRSELEVTPKALGKTTWAGGVDTVGDKVLANMLSTTKYGGAVAACGLAGGMNLPTTVAPFILRGVQLAGVESALVPIERRTRVYERFSPILVKSGKLDLVSDNSQIVGLEDVPGIAEKMLKGQIQGRYVVTPK